MNRFVGPLLMLGLGLCAASGCALSGPNRMSGLAQRMPWSREKQSLGESAQNGETSRGTVSFRAPKRQTVGASDEVNVVPGTSRREIVTAAATSKPESAGRIDDSSRVAESTTASCVTRDDTGLNPLLAGHSSDQSAAASERASSSSRSSSAGLSHNINKPTVAQAGHESTTIAHGEKPQPADDAALPTVTTANYRSDRDALSNPIQLQGVEAIASDPSTAKAANPNEPPLWANRPAAQSSRLSAGQVKISPQSGGRVQPVNAQSAPTVPPGSWQTEIERLIARAERDVAGLKPGANAEAQAEYRRKQVHLRLLYLMAERQEQALTVIPGLEPAEQEYWQQLCWAASNSLDTEQFPSPRDRAAQSIAPLNTALRRLREQSDLAIKNIAFCEQISYFGNYQKFERDEFTPGQEVLLYAEIENFNTEQTANGEHRTLLRSVIDITGSNGEARWHKTFPATEDRCRNPRRDYFHNYQFAIPDRLPLGPHTLKLTVVDDLSGKQASYSLSFLVK